MCEPLHTACDFTVGWVRRQLPPLLEDGRITADDFRNFTFANEARLWGTENPRFFGNFGQCSAATGGAAKAPRSPKTPAPCCRGANPDPRRRVPFAEK
jgi:hypothetical protein